MRFGLAVILFLTVFTVAAPAYAYIGPVIAFVSYLMGPVIAIIAAVAMVLYFPVRAFMKKRKKQKETIATDNESSDKNK